MIYFEDKARESLLEYLQKPNRKLILCSGKMDVLKKFKKDKSENNIYLIDNDDNGVIDDEIKRSIERENEFKNITDVILYKDKKIKEKYIVIFNEDFPAWLIKALNQIGKKPSNFGFNDKKGKFHEQIRESERKENFKKILIDMNKEKSDMLKELKEIFKQINHKE